MTPALQRLWLGMVLVCAGCGPSRPTPTPPSSPEPASGSQKTSSTTDPASAKSSSPRVLHSVPPFTLVNQRGEVTNRLRYHGKVWVANFFFTRCTATCPQQTARLAELARKLKPEAEQGVVRFASFSVDPENDTAPVLAAYAEERAIDTNSWDFLTGERQAIWQLCRDGFRVPVQADPTVIQMPILHTSQTVLIDQQGAIRGYYDGLSEAGLNALEADLRTVLAELKPVPEDILIPAWLTVRAAKQKASIAQSSVRHQFTFRDERIASGITFVNRVVPDAAKVYQATHYDHGTGVVPADVDGDGLVDLYFVSQLGGNQLWKNLGGGRFTDITDQAGVRLADRIGVTGSFADLDNDSDPDLVVTTVRGGNVLFRNDGGGRFTDVTESAGVGLVAHSSGVVCFDYDRDGLLDLFVCNVGVYTTDTRRPEGNFAAHADAFAGHLKPAERNERSVLYRNLGGMKFEDVTTATQLIDESWTGDATPLDANRDGWPDLYVLNMQGHDEYYENVEGKHFRKLSRELFPKTPWGAMGVKVFDFDNDGQLDLYITDMHSDMSQQVDTDHEKQKAEMVWPESLLRTKGQSVWGNALFRGTGPDAHEEISDRVGAENYWPWGLSVGDVNADGFDDAFIASGMNFPFRYAVNSLLLNEGGKQFVDAEFAVGIEPRPDGRTALPWFTCDCSGPDKDHIDCKDRTGRVSVWSSIGSRSSVIFDLDLDGDLDIVTNDFGSEPLVLLSNLADTTPDLRWLQVKLVGSASNRDGLGSLVTVKVAGQSYLKVHDGKTGYLSQGLVPLYYGLGTSTTVESVEVRWPSGKTQTVAGPLPSNQALVIREE
jgi:cytochrome oxidase Cu insertion factor (SCO1/SenC/PrrC family)